MSFWQKAWIKISTLLKAVLTLAVFLCLEYGVFSAFTYFGIDRQIYKGLYNFITCVLVFAAMFIYNLVCSKRKEPVFRMSKLRPDQVAALTVIALGMLGFVTTYLGVVDLISEYFKPVDVAIEEYRDSVDRFAEVPQIVIPLWDSFLYVFTLSFIVPVTEELTFRGVFFGELRKGFGSWISVVLSAIGFGILHGLTVHIGYAFVCGLIIASCYYLTDSLVAPILLHTIFNIFGSGIPTFMTLDCFKFSQETVSAFMLGVNMVAIVFMPLAVVAMAYLVIVKRKKENAAKASAEMASVTAETTEAVSEDNDVTEESSEVENAVAEDGSEADT